MIIIPDNQELWQKFASCEQNEMIITRNGRCLFPLLKFRLKLEEDDDSSSEERFKVALGMELVDEYKWKFRSGHWTAITTQESSPSKTNKPSITSPAHLYSPDSQLRTLSELASHPETLNFAKVKLSNQHRDDHLHQQSRPGYFHLASFYHYRPVVHLISAQNHFRFPVQECSFIAVTHYQNDLITHLKKHNNPHAKGFLYPDDLLSISATTPERPPRKKPGRKRKNPIPQEPSSHSDTSFESLSPDVLEASLALEKMSRTPRYTLPIEERSTKSFQFSSNAPTQYLTFNRWK